jgi:hypothetical protein
VIKERKKGSENDDRREIDYLKRLYLYSLSVFCGLSCIIQENAKIVPI